MTNGRRDARGLVDLIEVVYDGIERVRPHLWLERVTACIADHLGEGCGALAHGYDLRGPRERWHLSVPVVVDAPQELAEVVVSSFSRTPDADLLAWYGGAGAAGTFSELTGMTLDELTSAGDAGGRFDIRDQIYLNAANPEVDGVLFVANVPEARRLRAAEKQRLAMVAAHAAAAARVLRARHAAEAPRPAAIFTPSGRVAHVEAEHERAVPSLREQLARVERARGPMRRREPERAAALWRALVAGRYSTFDRFESDGKRFVVAYENAPDVVDPRGLTEREAVVASWAARGHPDKVVAYELGIAMGTVSALLARVYAKLGIRKRAELVDRLRAPSDVARVRLGTRGASADGLLFSSPVAPLHALDALSRSEREVAVAAGRGASAKSIALERRVTEATIRKQLRSSYAKLGVGNRVELARRIGRA